MRTTWAAAGLVLAAALTGCGGDDSSRATDDPEPSGSSSGTSSPSEPVQEGCPYLTADQVSAALGTPTTETAGTVHACFFDPESAGGPSVMLSRVDVQIDPADYATQSKALCRGDVTDVDAGDEAFACVMGLGPQGQVYDGKVLVTVAVNDAADDATGIAVAATLLPELKIPPAS
jgi:hypothetical protein